MKNEIVINGVHHVLVDGWKENCDYSCSLCEECERQNAEICRQLCYLLGGDENSRFEIIDIKK